MPVGVHVQRGEVPEPELSWQERDAKEIDALIAKGHGRHCACRIVWGDGECTCGLSERGRALTRAEQIDAVLSMPDLHHDNSHHTACPICGLCRDCGDCQELGCGGEEDSNG